MSATLVLAQRPRDTRSSLVVVPFQGAGVSGRLSVAFRPGEAGVYLVGSDLPAPPQGDVYEVWMIETGTPTSGGCVTPKADGSVLVYVDASLGSSDTMAVTVEPSSCPEAPTTTPILTADLTAV
jgi:hypothetical protein